MNLLEAIRIYVAQKRTHGHLYVIHERRLIYLSRQVGDIPLDQISVRQILNHLDGPKTSPMAWKKKHEFLRAFFDFWLARGAITVSPMPPKRSARAKTSVPYIYTQTEIKRLLQAARDYAKNNHRCIDSLTIYTFLIFLYGTGCFRSEAMRIRLKDVDLKRGTVSIHNRRVGKSRELPIGTDLKTILRKYLRVRRGRKSSDDHLFQTKQGKPFGNPTINKTFERIRLSAGIMRRDDAYYQPRMQDLRHTFAVHRISSWIKHGADLKRMLPALAVYMGQFGLGATERYLSLAPERFRPQLSQLGSKRKGKRWRDDTELMKFLEAL